MARLWIWMLAAELVGVGGVATADHTPSGTVTIESKSAAVGVGVSWGDGKLRYRGKTYSFSVKGLSVVDLGVSKVSAKGKVFHLDKVEVDVARVLSSLIKSGAGSRHRVSGVLTGR